MLFIIESPHQKVSDKTKQVVQEKFERFEKMFDRIEQYHIVLKKGKNDKQDYFAVEARLAVPGNDLFASEQAESYPVAAEKVCIDLENQIRKYKSKMIRKAGLPDKPDLERKS